MNEDRRFRLISRAIDGFVTLARSGFLVLTVILLGRYARDVLIAFAGKETVANLALSLIMNLQADRWFAYIVGAMGVGYGAVERHLRRRNIRRLTTHTAELEKRLYPARSSSELTPEGKTRREEMISDAQFVAAFSVIISTPFVLVIWRWLAGYHADNLRDELFTVRDKMFLYALDRGIVDTVAHENLRRLMNSLIRYAHRVSLGRLILLDLSSRVFKIRPTLPKTYVEWVEAVAALPADEAERMRDFHAQATFLMMKHMVTGSPLLWAGCVVVAFHVAVIKSTRDFIDAVVRSVTRRFPSVDLFEADALRTM